MNFQTPLIAYFEGTALLGDTLYNYVSSINLQITGVRVLSRGGTTLTVNFLKNGTLFDQVVINSSDVSQSIPQMNFSAGDNLTIQVAVAPSSTLEGLTFIFDCTVWDSVDASALTNSKRIQTPLCIRYEGVLVQGDTFFSYSPTQRIQSFAYTITLRNPADQQVIVALQNNGSTVVQLTLNANATYQTGLISIYYNPGDNLSLQLIQVGTIANPGQSMMLLLDYLNTDQIAFSNFQTPFILEYEGLPSSASNEIIQYACPRGMTLAAIQLFLRDAIGSNIQVGIYKNGQIFASAVITAGNTQTQPTALNITYASGDLLEVRLLSPTSLGAGVITTIDYSIDAGGNAESYIYYSDPQSDIVILARQVGVGSKKADSIDFSRLEKYQKDVDNIINARLRTFYRTPLRKLQQGINNPWPGAIQMIAQRFVLRYMLQDIYSDVEPNASANVAAQEALAKEDFNLIVNRQVFLEGQFLRSSNPGSNAYTAPLTTTVTESSASSSLFPK